MTTYTGSNGNDVLSGTAGDDVFEMGQGGNDTVQAGAGDDLIRMGSSLNALDQIDGGDGFDTVELRGNYAHLTLAAGSLANVDELLLDGGYSYNITTNDGNVAAGANLLIDASALAGGKTLHFDGGAETNGSFTVYGGAGNDYFSGGAGNDVFRPGAGNDVIYGNGGADTVDYSDAVSKIVLDLNLTGPQTIGGGEGKDTINGVEYATGSSFNDTMTGVDGVSALDGGAGDDVLIGGFALYGGAGNDTIKAAAGSTAFQYLEGAEGNDKISANGATSAVLSYVHATAGVTVDLGNTRAQDTIGAGVDTVSGFHILLGSTHDDHLTGTSGDDTIGGYLGDDVINGGGGFDIVFYQVGPGPVTVDLAITGPQNTTSFGMDTLTKVEGVFGTFDYGDTISGNSVDNTLVGYGGDDTLSGRAGNDTLQGGDGNDVLSGGPGNDSLDGGAGTDTADYSSAAGAVTVDLNISTAQAVGGGEGSDTLTSIENLTGSAGADTLTGLNGIGKLTGGDGNDILVGGFADYGNAGNDTLRAPTGSTAVVLLDGGDGDDTIDANGDASAGAGYVDAASSVTVNLSLTGPQNTVGAGMDTLIGVHLVTGSPYDDHLTGSSGDDTLNGWLGNDVIDGGAGFDTWIAIYGPGPVTVDLNITGPQDTGGLGTDTITNIEAVWGTLNYGDTLTGNGGANTLYGFGGDDVLTGNGGADTLSGGDGQDVLNGGTGADTINGGAGSDDLTGGAGADTFVFATLGDSTSDNPDTIEDFATGDHIDLSQIDADTATPGDQAFHVGGGGGHPGDLIVTYNATTDQTSIDLYVDNDATVDATIWLAGNHQTLSSSDFVL